VFYQAAGIIHRDLKPANILIAREPNGTYVPKIGDFGISKAFVADAHTQMSNTIQGGTLHFAAPEQLLGDKLGFNADLWSYGILLYWLFVGEHPVEMSQSNTLSYQKQCVNYLEILKTWTLPEKVKQIPQPFQDWVEKCLVVDASKRVKSPHELSVPVIYVDPPTPPVPLNPPIPAPQPQPDAVVETVPPIVNPKPSPQPEPVNGERSPVPTTRPTWNQVKQWVALHWTALKCLIFSGIVICGTKVSLALMTIMNGNISYETTSDLWDRSLENSSYQAIMYWFYFFANWYRKFSNKDPKTIVNGKIRYFYVAVVLAMVFVFMVELFLVLNLKLRNV
jgi:serine/threonine protein kinase